MHTTTYSCQVSAPTGCSQPPFWSNVYFPLCTALSLSSCQIPINTTHLIWVPCVGCVNRNSWPLQCCYIFARFGHVQCRTNHVNLIPILLPYSLAILVVLLVLLISLIFNSF